MNRDQLAHVLRAAAAITEEQVFVIVGSQAALGQFGDLPPVMARSVEVDLFPKLHPDLAELIEGSIGQDSMFHETFGYHADAVGPETARLPRDWEVRAVQFRVGEIVAICPEIHDLAVSKLLAGRNKDIEWLEAGIGASLIKPARVSGLLAQTVAEPAVLELARARLTRLSGQPGEGDEHD